MALLLGSVKLELTEEELKTLASLVNWNLGGNTQTRDTLSMKIHQAAASALIDQGNLSKYRWSVAGPMDRKEREDLIKEEEQ